MKKVFNVLALGTVALAAGAQQLPNPGFEGSWVDSRPWNTICDERRPGTSCADRHAA